MLRPQGVRHRLPPVDGRDVPRLASAEAAAGTPRLDRSRPGAADLCRTRRHRTGLQDRRRLQPDAAGRVLGVEPVQRGPRPQRLPAGRQRHCLRHGPGVAAGTANGDQGRRRHHGTPLAARLLQGRATAARRRLAAGSASDAEPDEAPAGRGPARHRPEDRGDAAGRSVTVQLQVPVHARPQPLRVRAQRNREPPGEPEGRRHAVRRRLLRQTGVRPGVPGIRGQAIPRRETGGDPAERRAVLGRDQRPGDYVGAGATGVAGRHWRREGIPRPAAVPGRHQGRWPMGGDLQQIRHRLRAGEPHVERLPRARQDERVPPRHRGSAVLAQYLPQKSARPASAGCAHAPRATAGRSDELDSLSFTP